MTCLNCFKFGGRGLSGGVYEASRTSTSAAGSLVTGPTLVKIHLGIPPLGQIQLALVSFVRALFSALRLKT